jgi:uncharacterized damage-inducible protein DinB
MAKANLAELINAAFALKVPMGPLGHLPLNYMGLAIFAVLGLLNPGFWLLGLAAETMYIYALVSNKRFQNFVNGNQMLRQKKEVVMRAADVVSQLDEQRRATYDRLSAKCAELTKDLEGEFFGSIGDQVNHLQIIFARMLLLEQKTQEALDKVDTKNLEKNIAYLEGKSKEEADDAVRRSLEGSLEIQQKRLQNIRKSESNLRLTRVEIERIKNQVNLISEEIVMNRDPEQLSTLLNGVVRSIQDTSKFVAENSSVIDSIETVSPTLTVKN